MSALQSSALSTIVIFTSIKVIQHHNKSYSRMVMNNSTSSRKAAPLLSPAGARELLSSADAFIFNCDGVVWRGTKLIDVVPEKNGTWVLIDLPPGKKPIGCKWVYRIKYHSDGSVERYKA